MSVKEVWDEFQWVFRPGIIISIPHRTGFREPNIDIIAELDSKVGKWHYGTRIGYRNMFIKFYGKSARWVMFFQMKYSK